MFTGATGLQSFIRTVFALAGLLFVKFHLGLLVLSGLCWVLTVCWFSLFLLFSLIPLFLLFSDIVIALSVLIALVALRLSEYYTRAYGYHCS